MFVARFPATIGVLDRSLVISNFNPQEEFVDAYPSQAFRWHIGGLAAGADARLLGRLPKLLITTVIQSSGTPRVPAGAVSIRLAGTCWDHPDPTPLQGSGFSTLDQTVLAIPEGDA